MEEGILNMKSLKYNSICDTTKLKGENSITADIQKKLHCAGTYVHSLFSSRIPSNVENVLNIHADVQFRKKKSSRKQQAKIFAQFFFYSFSICLVS